MTSMSPRFLAKEIDKVLSYWRIAVSSVGSINGDGNQIAFAARLNKATRRLI